MLSEVLSSQNGDEAFMNTVDELQRQLNDQESEYIPYSILNMFKL